MQQIKFFEYDRAKLDDREKRVVDILIEAGTVIHSIWDKQLDHDSGKADFYPKSVSKSDILNAAKKDPEILSPYTKVVEEKGELKAIHYSKLYAEDLKKVVELLKQACLESNDPALNSYLGKIADAVAHGDFDKLEEIFLQNRDTKIEVMLGPIETYEDKLLSKKKAFQYNLRILSPNATNEATEMINIMKQMNVLRPEGSVGKQLMSDEIYVRVDNVVMLAGRQAGVLLSSSNHPNDPDKVKKYGSKIVVFTTSMYEKFDNRLSPLLDKVKDQPDLPSRNADMKEATFRLVALHEITEGVVKFEGMQDRLGMHQDYIRELNADVLGVHSAKYHVLNGIITNEQYKDLLTMFLLFAIDTCNSFGSGGSIEEYSKGFAIAFNYFYKTGAINFSGGKVQIDFTKLSRDLEALANIILQIMKEGTEADAQDLLDEYGDFDIFKKLPKA